jgi:hypothetical protein
LCLLREALTSPPSPFCNRISARGTTWLIYFCLTALPSSSNMPRRRRRVTASLHFVSLGLFSYFSFLGLEPMLCAKSLGCLSQELPFGVPISLRPVRLAGDLGRLL